MSHSKLSVSLSSFIIGFDEILLLASQFSILLPAVSFEDFFHIPMSYEE